MAADTTDNQRPGRRYHHGDLPAALIRTSFELLAEHGLAAFSVAQVARRLDISTAAPYRHFSDRSHLLAAVATTAARELADAIRTAAADARADPVDRFAAAAAAYVRFAVSRGAGFNVIYAAGLQELHDQALADAGRQLMDLLIALAEDTGERPERDRLRLVENLIVLAHGYATLYHDGFFARGRYSLDDIAARASQASRELATPR